MGSGRGRKEEREGGGAPPVRLCAHVVGGQSTQGSAVVASHERTQRKSPVGASIPGLASRAGGCECGGLQDDNTFLRKGKRKITGYFGVPNGVEG